MRFLSINFTGIARGSTGYGGGTFERFGKQGYSKTGRGGTVGIL
jgi:hypothetical protein